MSATVILWTWFKVALDGQQNVPWPGLHNAIAITLYHDKPYGAIWVFQPLGTGTAILLAGLVTALLVRLSPAEFFGCIRETVRQVWLAVITVMLIVGLAYLMNYSGLAYTLGQGVASTGKGFILFSPFLGWVAVLLSGSDTSGNALSGTCRWWPPGSCTCIRCFRRHQLVRRRHGKDDFAAEHRDGGLGDQSEGPRRRRLCPHLHP